MKKAIKDLSFLCDLPATKFQGITKYILTQGTQNLRSSQKKQRFLIDVSQYTYQGMKLRGPQNWKIQYPYVSTRNTLIPEELIGAVQQMRLNQISWFNVHSNKTHYKIVLKQVNDIFQIAQTIQDKIKQSNKAREKGIKLFQKQDYREAMKNFFNAFNLASSIPRKSIPDIKKQKKDLYYKAMRNYIVTFFKLENDVTKEMQENIQRFSQVLVNKRNQESKSHYLRGKVLIYNRYITDGIQELMKAYRIQWDDQKKKQILQQVCMAKRMKNK